MKTATGSSEQKVPGGEPGRGPNLLWLVVVWGRVVVGLGLAAIGGVSFGHAWTSEDISMWGVGAVTLLTGVLLVLSALYARSDAVPAGRGPEPPARVVSPGERLVPLLGALLVYKYQLINHHQLAAAIEEQKKSKKRIGEILVGMGLITNAQLQEALEHQRSLMPKPAQESPQQPTSSTP